MLEPGSMVTQKTRELCEAILAQPEYRSIQERVLAFEEDEQAQGLYEALTEKEQEIAHKRESGTPLGEGDLAELDSRRQELVGNPVAKAFMDAREEAGEIQRHVALYLSKTFEFGCVPGEEDIGVCDHGCSCR